MRAARVVTSPLRFWRRGQLERVAALLQCTLEKWAADWDVPLEPGGVSCRPAAEVGRDPAFCKVFAGNEVGTASAAGSFHQVHEVAARLFGVTVDPGTIAFEVAAECAADGLARIASALGLARVEAPHDSAAPPERQRWSGAVAVQLPCNASLILTHAVIENAVRGESTVVAPIDKPVRAPLAAPLAALAGRALPLEVMLDGCELELATLQGLQRGDVLRVQHRLDTPALVRSATGAALFRGHLACKDGRKAIQLDSHPVSTMEGGA